MSLFHSRYLVFVGVMFVTGISVVRPPAPPLPEPPGPNEPPGFYAIYSTQTMKQIAEVDTISSETSRQKNDEVIRAKTMEETADGVVTKPDDSLGNIGTTNDSLSHLSCVRLRLNVRLRPLGPLGPNSPFDFIDSSAEVSPGPFGPNVVPGPYVPPSSYVACPPER